MHVCYLWVLMTRIEWDNEERKTAGDLTIPVTHKSCAQATLMCHTMMETTCDPQRSLRSERGTPMSAPMHYLWTHAGQGMADRQGFSRFHV